MNALDIVSALLNQDEEPVEEATVRLPPRSRRWVAVFTGVEPGTQVVRSTGLTDRDAAMAQARQWEDGARRERARRNGQNPPRINHPHGCRDAGLTQAEVAAFLGLSERAIRAIEQRALRKLRRHPLLRQIWAELSDRYTVEEDSINLEPEEIEALFGLVRTDFERRVLLKVLV